MTDPRVEAVAEALFLASFAYEKPKNQEPDGMQASFRLAAEKLVAALAGPAEPVFKVGDRVEVLHFGHVPETWYTGQILRRHEPAEEGMLPGWWVVLDEVPVGCTTRDWVVLDRNPQWMRKIENEDRRPVVMVGSGGKVHHYEADTRGRPEVLNPWEDFGGTDEGSQYDMPSHQPEPKVGTVQGMPEKGWDQKPANEADTVMITILCQEGGGADASADHAYLHKLKERGIKPTIKPYCKFCGSYDVDRFGAACPKCLRARGLAPKEPAAVETAPPRVIAPCDVAAVVEELGRWAENEAELATEPGADVRWAQGRANAFYNAAGYVKNCLLGRKEEQK